MSYKKEILSGLVILAIAGGVTFNYSLNAKNKIVLPNTVLATIEALADGEDPNSSCKWLKETCPKPNWYTPGKEREVCLSDGDGNSCTCGATTRPCD